MTDLGQGTSDHLGAELVLGLDNVALELPIAGLGNRVLAASIDQVILFILNVLAVIAGVALVAVFAPGFGGRVVAAVVIVLVLLFVLNTGYFIVFEIALAGQTPGKKVLGLRVVTSAGGRPGAGAFVTRNLLRVIDMFIGVPMMAVDVRARRLGDRLAGTLVVHTRPGREELVLAHLPAGWGGRQAAVVEALLQRAAGLEPARAEGLAWRVVGLVERDDPGFLEGIDRTGSSLEQLRRAFSPRVA